MDEGCVKQPQALDVKEDHKKIERKLGKSKSLEGLIWQNMKTLLALPLQMSLDKKHFWKQAWLAIRDTRQGCIFKKALSNRRILGGIDFDNRLVNTFMNEFKKNCNMGKKMASKLKMLAEKSMVEGINIWLNLKVTLKFLSSILLVSQSYPIYRPGGQNKALEEVWACQQGFLTYLTIFDNDWPWSVDSDRLTMIVQ